MMIKLFQIAALMTVLASDSFADGTPETSDVYMISRNDNGLFHGSHKIFRRESEGLHKVEYCGRSYWVRPVTVAWTELEKEYKREVRIEFNWGKGWRPVCDRPTEYVTLADLGVDQEARFVVGSNGSDIKRASRFDEISKAFKQKRSSKWGRSSFHIRLP